MRTLIYAVGGGHGHRTRARTLARRLGDCTIVHEVADPATFVDRLLDTLGDHDRLVVDSFPAGVGHELDDRFFGRIPTVLVARYVRRDRYADYDTLAARFDERWLPYDAARSEWEEPPAGTWLGPVVRPLEVDGEADTVVIGDPATAPEAWRRTLAACAVVNGPFDRLPRARRYVALGCGYNLGWELASLRLSAAFRPLPRRFDDQFRRAALLGRPLLHHRDLEAFLGDEAPAG